MTVACRFPAFLAAIFLVLASSAHAQVVTATIPVGGYPDYAAVNPVTNTIYESNWLCTDIPCQSPGTVTVINGVTNAMIGTVNAGVNPIAIAVNTTTNKIYVANFCGSDPTCQSLGTVTVIDGSTLQTSTVTTGYAPAGIAVNPVTNEIYVANQCVSPYSPSNGCVACSSQMLGTITVINGSTLSTQTVQGTCGPTEVAVNATTNTIYVVNIGGMPGTGGAVTVIDGNTLSTQIVPIGIFGAAIAVDATHNVAYATDACGNDPNCQSGGNVTAINGATLATQTAAVGFSPFSIAVNPLTNKVYVGNYCGNSSCSTQPTATVIDGATLSTTTVPVCSSAEDYALGVTVNTGTNQIYLACNSRIPGVGGHTVTDLDGASNTTFPIAVGDEPSNVAVNPMTNSIYVPNFSDATVSVIGGATKAQLFTVTPCRLVDTRQNNDPIMGGTSRSFNLPQLGGCSIPDTAIAYSLNVTVVPNRTLGYLTIWPTSQIQPVISTLNSPDGRIKANAAIVPAGVGGAVSVYVTDTTNVILDIDGYFAPSTTQSLQFYPLTPCRVVDTRQTNFPPGLGAPSFGTKESRPLPVLMNSPCLQGLPNIPQAYSFNVTVVPNPSGQPLGYLTIWPSNEQQPTVSTLNNPTATVVANAAIVPADPTDGSVSVYTYNSTDVIIDVNGYFATPASGGYSFYPTVPCRVLDTRANNGPPFSGTLNPPVNVPASPCGPPLAQGYVFNATVVPSPTLEYLTLWPDTENMPVVSTLNAYDGFITSNMAVLPDVNGNIDAYANGTTQLILDISGFFAP